MSTPGWRVPINLKLLAILAVPVLGYLIIATTAVVHAQQAADQISDQAGVVRIAVGPISLTTSLIDERTITGLENAGIQDDLTLRIGNSADARRATDEQLAALQSLMADNRAALEAYEPAVDELAGELETLRADLDASTGDDAPLLARYDEFISGLMDANAHAVGQVEEAELWQGAMLSELATRQKDARAMLINALIPISLNNGTPANSQQTAEIGASLRVYENRNAAIHELATGPYARPGSVLAEALEAGDLAELARNTLESGQLDPQRLYDVASYKGGFVYDLPSGDYIHDSFRAAVVEILDENASERTAAAARGVRTHLLAGSIGLVVTAGIAWAVSRSITRPLRSLTEQVIDTATHRLPGTVHDILETPLGEDVTWPEMEPISVTTNDEVADVADAFNTMQQSALDLAVEEAVLRRLVTDSLVSLGQRNQDLLGRQLDFITDLERDETDPDTLADLFYLDHLAVRMRRNAESLLVLAGYDPPRTWLGPTAIDDIIRAGLGEAKEYKRVRVQDVEPATVAGAATAELAHLLAELIENALTYSPRGETVHVNGRHRSATGPGDGPSDGYTVTIVDSGVGMTARDIEQANRRLAGIESYTMAPSKFMGHYVTGKLAARHGIAVELHSDGPNRGVTATVDIPGSLLTTEAPSVVQTHLPPLPDLELVDLSAPVPLPNAGAYGQPVSAEAPRKPRKPKTPKTPKKRPLAASKLPVPPPPTETLAIQPLEAPPDAGEAS